MARVACVTGANGFLGSFLVKMLLQRGYSVRATVRIPNDSPSKLALLESLKELGDLEIFAGDLMVAGSFDEAVATCEYVFHVACPVNLADEDPENNLIRPAVEGTLNLMKACTKARTVKRVILTSSAAAVSVNRREGSGLVVDEKDWTDVEFLTAEKPPTWGYLVGKTEGEKAAWRYAEANNLDLVTVNPVLIVGPALSRSPPNSTRVALSFLTGDNRLVGAMKIMQALSGSVSLVHVEDVCRAQIHLAESETATGRYVLSPVNSGVLAVADFVAVRYAPPSSPLDLAGVPPKPKLLLSSAKIVNEGFDFKYDTLEAIYDDLVNYGYEVGLLQKK